MERLTLAWFQWMTRDGLISSWPGLLQALEVRFVPSQYEDPIGTLFKLTRGIVHDFVVKTVLLLF